MASLCREARPRRAKTRRAMVTRRRRRCARSAATTRCELTHRCSSARHRPVRCSASTLRHPPRGGRCARTRARRRRRCGQESWRRAAACELSWRRQSAAPAARCAAGGGSSNGSRVCVPPPTGWPRPPAGLGLGRGWRAARDSPAGNARAVARATPPDQGEEGVQRSTLELEQCMCSGYAVDMRCACSVYAVHTCTCVCSAYMFHLALELLHRRSRLDGGLRRR